MKAKRWSDAIILEKPENLQSELENVLGYNVQLSSDFQQENKTKKIKESPPEIEDLPDIFAEPENIEEELQELMDLVIKFWCEGEPKKGVGVASHALLIAEDAESTPLIETFKCEFIELIEECGELERELKVA